MKRTERMIQARGESIMAALRQLIGLVRMTEWSERGRSTKAEFSVEVELTAGGVETWTVTIERTASSH